MIDDLIRARLHKQTITVTGYTCVSLKREDDFEMVETAPNGEKTYAMGGNYRLVIT